MTTFDKPQGLKDVKHSFGFPSPDTSFTVPKPSASTTFSDSTLKSKPFQTNVPVVVKPSATTFSFLPPSSATGAFTFSKNDETKSVGTTQSVVIPSQDSKFSFNVSKKEESTVSTTSTLQGYENKDFTLGGNAANQTSKFGLSNILNSGASSTNVSKSAVTTQQPVATSSSLFSSLAGQPLSFGNKDSNQSKPFSFFSQTLSSKTPTSPPVSTDGSEENSPGFIITSVQSVKPQESVKSIFSTTTRETTPTSPSLASAFSFKVNTSNLPSTPFSANQSTFTQSPVNLTQTKTVVSTSDSPLNLAGATSQNAATSESKTVSLESIITSALDKKTPLSESEQANQQTFKSLFGHETTTSSLTFSSTSSQQQSTSVTTASDLTTKSIFAQPALLAVSSSTPLATTTAATGFTNAPSTTVPEQDASTTATSTALSQTATSTAPNTVFGSAPNTTAPNSVFGQLPLTSAGTPAFGQAAASVSGPAAATTSTPVFGQAASSTPSFFGQAATTQPSFFGGQATTTQSASIFGQPATTPVTQNQVFGATATTTASGPFTQAAGSFFSKPLGGQTSVFGSNTANTAASTGFGSQASTASSFSFGKSTFGEQTQGLVFLGYCC